MNSPARGVAPAADPDTGEAAPAQHLPSIPAPTQAVRSLLPERASAILEMARYLTKLDATYITAIDLDGNQQQVTHVDRRPNTDIGIDEGTTTAWTDSICRRAASTGVWATDDVARDLPGSPVVEELGIRSYVGVPITDPDNRLIATLCGVSRNTQPTTAVARSGLLILAGLIAEQWESTTSGTQVEASPDGPRILQTVVGRATALAEAEHQLKSPLAIITGWAETLLDNPTATNDPELRRGLNAIVRASRRATDGLDTLITETRGLREAPTEEPSDVLSPTTVNLSELTVEVAEDLGRLCSPSHHLDTRIAEDLWVRADREALHQVLWHLAENAVKYSPHGGTITLTLDQPDLDTSRVTLTDSGIGIPPGTDVFAAFTRGDNTANIPGTGLGLHIVQRLTEIMNGTITAEPATPGSTFTLTLPLASYKRSTLGTDRRHTPGQNASG